MIQHHWPRNIWLGPIIRVTPDEIHVNDVGFLDTVYAPSMSRKDKYSYQLRSLRVPGGVGAAARHDVHKRRRDALSPFFSKRNVLYLEPMITKKVEQLCQLIAKHTTEKTPINLSDAFFAFSNEYKLKIISRQHNANIRKCRHKLLIRPSDRSSCGWGKGCYSPSQRQPASDGNQRQQALPMASWLPRVSPVIYK